jgi:hypothetical protein
MNYRQLTRHEIAILEKQGCVAEDWTRLSVKPEFNPDYLRNVMFAGDVKLGLFNNTVEIEPGILKHSGIYDSSILNCCFGDNVYISNIDNLVNYDVADDVIIENVNTLTVSGENTFGNGTEIDIINEKANRTLMIYDQLTAQIAYMFVFYRHDKEMIRRLEEMIKEYVESKKSGKGTIGDGARILNTRTIRNVNVGEYAIISGTTHLEDGTISCTKDEPVMVGGDVIALKFIILSGSVVDSASYLEKCFIGQGVIIGRMFSAENSAFFANCEGLNGEALSIFAGPYTVSHHKSTLLIAAFYSFFNAGSGSNQSNHLYKLGPVHQGILERGVKTGSFSYLMWPSRIGAFNVVIGKHFVHVDTSPFPFSYMVESGGKSLLLPAQNLFTAGTLRDSSKWQPRDRRQIGPKLDLICFDLFNPYLVGKIIEGITILRKINEEVPPDQETADFKGVSIRRKKLDHSISQYELAVKIFIGNEVIKMLEAMGEKAAFKEIREYLSVNGVEVSKRWIDMAGMVAPQSAIEDLISDIKSDKIKTISDLGENLQKVHNNYQKYSWTWCMGLIRDFYKIDINNIKPDQLIKIITAWKDSLSKQTELILQDAGKEYDEKRRIGYGIDGDEQVRNADFDEVRGLFENNKFIIETKNDFEKTLMKFERLTSLISSLAEN